MTDTFIGGFVIYPDGETPSSTKPVSLLPSTPGRSSGIGKNHNQFQGPGCAQVQVDFTIRPAEAPVANSKETSR